MKRRPTGKRFGRGTRLKGERTGYTRAFGTRGELIGSTKREAFQAEEDVAEALSRSAESLGSPPPWKVYRISDQASSADIVVLDGFGVVVDVKSVLVEEGACRMRGIVVKEKDVSPSRWSKSPTVRVMRERERRLTSPSSPPDHYVLVPRIVTGEGAAETDLGGARVFTQADLFRLAGRSTLPPAGEMKISECDLMSTGRGKPFHEWLDELGDRARRTTLGRRRQRSACIAEEVVAATGAREV